MISYFILSRPLIVCKHFSKEGKETHQEQQPFMRTMVPLTPLLLTVVFTNIVTFSLSSTVVTAEPTAAVVAEFYNRRRERNEISLYQTLLTLQ